MQIYIDTLFLCTSKKDETFFIIQNKINHQKYFTLYRRIFFFIIYDKSGKLLLLSWFKPATIIMISDTFLIVVCLKFHFNDDDDNNNDRTRVRCWSHTFAQYKPCSSKNNIQKYALFWHENYFVCQAF